MDSTKIKRKLHASFINRQQELSFLTERYKKSSAELIILYGRRRVGKTSLLLHFSRDKPALYLLADLKPEKEQLRDFSFQMARELDDPLLEVQPLESVEALFTYFARLWSQKRIVVIIDEFPYLCRVNHAFSSILQKYWDIHLNASKAFLVLCGSSIGMMEKETLLQQSPLYGRRTGDWLVTPLKFKDFLQFFPDTKFEDVIQLYGIVGGIPEYILKIDQTKTVHENIISIIKKGSPLYQEVNFLIKEELNEPHNYFAIMKAIAFGKNKPNEIVMYTGLDKGIVSKYLSVLENLQLVKRIASLTENLERTRKGLYILVDSYFRFWFRFCFPFRSLLEEGKEELLLKTVILPNFPQYVSSTFEAVCRESLSLEFDEIGAWWHKGQEIDVVAQNKSKNTVLFGECKWTNTALGMDELQKLITVSQSTEIKAKTMYYALFSKAGFTKDLEEYAKRNKNILLFNLNRLKKNFNR